jgi:uncharacterized membrane protein
MQRCTWYLRSIPIASTGMEAMQNQVIGVCKKVGGALHQWPHFLAGLRNKLLTGILVAIPLVVTIWVLNLAYGFIKSISEPLLSKIWISQTKTLSMIPGVSFAVTLIMLILLGFMATNVLGKRMLEGFDHLLMRIPIVSTIYAGVKQVIDSFKSFNSVSDYKRVAYVEYPSEGSKLIGFVTGQYFDSTLQKEMTSVIIPTAPNPMTGLVVVIESSRVIDSSLTMEEATKMILSAGLLVPKRNVTTAAQPNAVSRDVEIVSAT